MFENYYKSCKARGLSEQTIKTYKIGLNLLEKFMREEALSLNDLSKAKMDEFILDLDNGKRNRKTINSHLISVRTYLYYEMENERMPQYKIPLLKAEETFKEIYTDKELERLLEKPKKAEGFTTFKTWALINFLFGTGCRLSTALSIKIEDLDLDDAQVRFRKTKNKRQQIVPLSSGLVNVLVSYLAVRKGEPQDFLFCNSYGEEADIRSTQQQIANYNRKRKVDKTSSHLFRHSFATKYIKNGGDIYRLSKLLGHSSLAITENYIHTLPVEMIGNYDALNPLEQFTKKRKIRMS